MVKDVQASATAAAYETLRANLQRERQVAEKLTEAVEDANEEAVQPAAGAGRGQVIDIIA